MNYQETIGFLYSQLPVFQKDGASAYHKNLDRTLALCEEFGNPQDKLKFIHVAGTNGKGTTCHVLAATLQHAGIETGLYTSPHLKSFTERIRINGQEMEQQYVVDFVAKHQAVIERIKPSFFELTVAMCFCYFEANGVEMVVLETGMGGALDSTNVVQPVATAITNVSLDHTMYLGDTVEKIAFEKAGIAKTGAPLVVGEVSDSVFAVIESRCEEVKVVPTRVSMKSDMDYEEKNFELAHAVLDTLPDALLVDDKFFEQAKLDYKTTTGLKGRWQVLQESPKVVCDTGHNEAGIQEILKKLKREKYDKLHVVWGMVSDKSHHDVLSLLPKDAFYYFCAPDIHRALDVQQLFRIAQECGLRGQAFNSVGDAIDAAYQEAQSDDFIWIGGSTFVVAEVEDL